jgi:hypothetical protein
MSGVFTTANTAALEAVGRVSNGGRRPSFALTIENNYVLHCVTPDGFSLSVNLVAVVDDELLDVRCTLADGVEITCSGTIDKTNGRIRLDADDQVAFYWFWFEVRPNFRHVLQ